MTMTSMTWCVAPHKRTCKRNPQQLASTSNNCGKQPAWSLVTATPDARHERLHVGSKRQAPQGELQSKCRLSSHGLEQPSTDLVVSTLLASEL